MPTYTFKNNETNEEWTTVMSMSEREDYLLNNPHVTQLITNISLGDSVRLGIRKPDQGFRDVLREVKKAHPRGGGINTF